MRARSGGGSTARGVGLRVVGAVAVGGAVSGLLDFLSAPAFVWCCAVGTVLCAALAAWSRATVRVVWTNAAAILVVFLLFDLSALGRLRYRFAPGRTGERGVPVGRRPARALDRRAIALMPSSRGRAGWPGLRPARARIEPERWHEVVSAKGLTTLMSGWLYRPPGDAHGWMFPSNAVRQIVRHHGARIYDVVYTISASGFRATWPSREDLPWPRAPRGAVLFFGDSFTFGEGVNDHETLPSAFQRQSGGVFRSCNFGVGGGGASEMLATLEAQLERADVAGERPLLAVYLALNEHPARTVGTGTWQRGRPRYLLEDGAPVRHGGFGGPGWEPVPQSVPVLSPAAMRSLCASPFMCMVAEGVQGRAVAAQSRSAIALWRAVVRRAQDVLRARYGVPLLVVLWDRDTPLDDEVIAAVLAANEERGGIQVASVRLMPELFDGRFYIPVDEHPTPQAYEALAAALLDAIEDGRIRLGPMPASG